MNAMNFPLSNQKTNGMGKNKKNFYFLKTKMQKIKIFLGFLIFRLLLILFTTYVTANTRQELAYDVVWAQLQYSQYLMSIDQWVPYNAEIDKANGIEIGNACFRLVGNDDMRMCKLNVCYQLWIPLSSCIQE